MVEVLVNQCVADFSEAFGEKSRKKVNEMKNGRGSKFRHLSTESKGYV